MPPHPDFSSAARHVRPSVENMQNKNDFILRYALFIVGLYLLAAGIVLILRSGLGTTPISSVNYVLSLNLPLSLGTCTFILNSVLILGQFWLVRKTRTPRITLEIVLQLPFSVLFGLFIDLNMYLTAGLHPANYAVSIATLLAGCLVQSAGVVMEVKPHVVMMSAEGFVYYASRYFGKEFGRMKVAVDVLLVLLALALSLLFKGRIEGIREGTLIAACCTGFIVSLLGRYVLTREHFERLIGKK